MPIQCLNVASPGRIESKASLGYIIRAFSKKKKKRMLGLEELEK
jgi:hypothetical protein